ncbi:hypothetical protein Tco_0827958 [Tanacetum coccineum]
MTNIIPAPPTNPPKTLDGSRRWGIQLKQTYDKVDGSIMFGLHHQINTLKQNGSSIANYYHKLNALWKQFDVMIELPKCVCNASEGFKKHNQLIKLMQFLMGLDDSYTQIRSSIFSREVLPDVRSAYATISSEEYHRVAAGSIAGSSQRNKASAFVSNVPNRNNFQRNTQNMNNGPRPNNMNNNRQDGGSGLVCENCGFNGHTINRCFKIIGYPADFGKKKSNRSFKGKNVSNNNSVRSSSSSGFTDKQIATLISLIKDNKIKKNMQANMAGFESKKARTWLKSAYDLEFIYGIWPQKPDMWVEDPHLALVYVKKLSRGMDISIIILQNISPDLRNGLEGITSLEMMNAIRTQHKMYVFIDMWTVLKMLFSAKFDRSDSFIFSASVRQYVMIIDMDQLSYLADIVCMECGKVCGAKVAYVRCGRGKEFGWEKDVVLYDIDELFRTFDYVSYVNPIRTLGDYYKPSHEGYRNTIKLPVGNNVVPLRSDTIRLVQNGCSFHGLRSEDPNQHLKDFLKLLDSLNLNGENKERTRTIDQSVGGKLRDRNAKESLPLLDDLAFYDNESWNDPRDSAKPVKAISLPQDVSSTSDSHLIELENRVQRLMEAHLAPMQPTQVNKITSSYEIMQWSPRHSALHGNPEQAFVEYASSRIDEAGVRSTLSQSTPSNKGDSHDDKPKQNKEEEKGRLENIDTNPSTPPDPSVSFITEKVLKLNSFFESLDLVPQSSDTEFVCTKRDDGDVMFIEIVKKDDDSGKEEPKVGGLAVEYFDIFPT